MEVPVEDEAEVDNRKGGEEEEKRGWREDLNGAPCAEKPATAIAPAALPSLLQPAPHHPGAPAADDDDEAERGTSGKARASGRVGDGELRRRRRSRAKIPKNPE